MSIDNFSILEAVEVAVGIEEEGIRFYTLAAQKVEDPEMKKLFETLREKEHDHIKTFRNFYADLEEKKGDPNAELYLFDPEIAANFRGYVETAVFPVPGDAPSRDTVLALLRRVSRGYRRAGWAFPKGFNPRAVDSISPREVVQGLDNGEIQGGAGRRPPATVLYFI